MALVFLTNMCAVYPIIWCFLITAMRVRSLRNDLNKNGLMRIFKCWGLYLFLTVIPLLQSCLNDSNDWPEETKLALVTVRLFDNQSPSDYYFVMYNNQTIIPLNTAFLDYTAIDGQRAFVYFTFIENEVLSDESSTHYAEVIYIENILTKDIVELTCSRF